LVSLKHDRTTGLARRIYTFWAVVQTTGVTALWKWRRCSLQRAIGHCEFM